MRYYEYQLNEYNRDITAKNYSSKIVAVARRDRSLPAQFRDPKAVTDEQLADLVLDQIEKSDPTRNKEYAQALAKIYTQGQTQFEDMGSTLADYLVKFHKLKLKKVIPSPRNDFMRYASVADFMSVVDEYPDVGEEPEDKGEAKEVYRDADLRIIVPLDTAGACYYGRGTKWCTAAKNNNMFDRYNKEGEMYIIIPTKPAYKGEKYQFHFPTKQFMNEQDRRVNLSELRARFPQLVDIFEKQVEKYHILALDKDIKDVAASMQQALPVFRETLKGMLFRESKSRAKEIYVELGRAVRTFKGMEEVWELAEDMLDERGISDLAMMAVNVIRDDPDIANDDDLLYDALGNNLTDFVRDTELWAYIDEVLEELEDEESEFDAAMTIEGELQSMMQNLIPEAFAESIKSIKGRSQ